MKLRATASRKSRVSLGSIVLISIGLLTIQSGASSVEARVSRDDDPQTKPAAESREGAATQSAPTETGRGAGRGRRGGRRPEGSGPTGSPISIEHVRVLRPGKPDLEDATVLVRGRRIVAVGRKIEVPDNAKHIDGTGATLTAGWIDAEGATPLDAATISDGNQNAAQKVTEGLDLLDSQGRIRAALERGVTSCYVSPGIGLFSGSGALIRMHPGERDPEKLTVDNSEGARFAFGSVRNEPPVIRLTQVSNLRKSLREAQKYRESLDQYDEDYQKYLEDKKKGLKPSSRPSDVEETSAPRDNNRPTPSPIPRGRRQPRTPEEIDFLRVARALGITPIVDDATGTYVLDDKAPVPGSEDEICGCGAPGPHEGHPKGFDLPFVFYQEPVKPADAKASADRPKKPEFNPSMLAMVAILRREVPVRIEARRADEILAAVGLAQEFKLHVVIEGADEATLVMDALLSAKLPVVLSPVRSSHERTGFEREVATASKLATKGIVVSIGTGHEFFGTQWLRTQVAAAIAGGLTRDQALAAVTTQAAEIIGVQDELGAIEPGKTADLVVFGGDPFDPATPVKVVILDGEVLIER